MKSDAELRQLAWQRLWADKWFGRLFGGGLLLGLCGRAVQSVLDGILGRLGVDDWRDYAFAVLKNHLNLTTPVPNLTDDYVFWTTSATALEVFIGCIMAGIASYGCAVILLRCLRNDEPNWLSSAFGGFRDPFGLLWLFVRLVLVMAGWSLLALLPAAALVGPCVAMIPSMYAISPVLAAAVVTLAASVGIFAGLAIGLVPFYRYRFLFLVKAEHPDWSTGACMRSCRALMAGNKMRSFRLDCSYWKAITLMLLPMLMMPLAVTVVETRREDSLAIAAVGLVAFVCVVGSIVLAVVVAQYISVGQGFLYLEIRDRQPQTEVTGDVPATM